MAIALFTNKIFKVNNVYNFKSERIINIVKVCSILSSGAFMNDINRFINNECFSCIINM